jgi:S1-C subfamily serine protease
MPGLVGYRIGFSVFLIIALLGAGEDAGAAAEGDRNTNIPVAAPIDTESAGKAWDAAYKSVVRVICPKENWGGSGFLHKSGKVITAEHVIHPCSEIIIVPNTGENIKASVLATDADIDLASLSINAPINAPALPISIHESHLNVGAQVSAWGFPAGYPGSAPLLSVGYLAGVGDTKKTTNGKVIQQWIVNAAFNGGNSGGPLLDIETGEVIGVVASKLAPISPTAKSALEALKNQQSGFMYEATRPDGSKFQISEGHVIELVLDELRNQVQLVIGMAVLDDDLLEFLKKQNIDP